MRVQLVSETYERNELSVIKPLLRPGLKILEIGGGMGIVTSVIAKNVGPMGRVVVLEPVPNHLRWLRANLKRNGLNHVIVVPRALSHSPEVTMDGSAWLHSSIKSDGSLRISASSVRDLWAEYGPFHMLVIDAEGAEYELFQYDSGFMHKAEVTIVAEVHPGVLGLPLETILEPLREAGFNIVITLDAGHVAFIVAYPH